MKNNMKQQKTSYTMKKAVKCRTRSEFQEAILFTDLQSICNNCIPVHNAFTMVISILSVTNRGSDNCDRAKLLLNLSRQYSCNSQ